MNVRLESGGDPTVARCRNLGLKYELSCIPAAWESGRQAISGPISNLNTETTCRASLTFPQHPSSSPHIQVICEGALNLARNDLSVSRGETHPSPDRREAGSDPATLLLTTTSLAV